MNRLTFRRVGALFVFMSLLASISVIGAPVALAHHPEISASTRCDTYSKVPVIDYTASSWAEGAKGTNANIGIYIDGVWVGSGSFTEGNAYSFGGTIDAADWAGKTVTISAKADGPWGNGGAGGDSRSTAIAVPDDCGGTTTTTVADTTTTTTPGYIPGNPSCVDLGYAKGVKTSPSADTTVDGVSFDYSGKKSVTVSSAGATIQAVIVKGGNGARLYTGSFVGLVAPLNNGGQQADISHVEACVEPYQTTTTTQATTTTTQATTTTTEAPESLVWVNVGRCEEVDGQSLTPVWVRIEPAGSATLTLLTPDGPIVFTESGSVRLEPARYFWTVEVADGYDLTGQAEGSFRTARCTSSDTMVAVNLGGCVYDGQAGVSRTEVELRIAPGGTATVAVQGPGGPYQIDGSGERLYLTPGTYTWTATPDDGYTLVGPGHGTFTVDDCSPVCEAMIGDVVWLDMGPHNGLQDEGEALIEGVVVHLLDDGGTTLATTSTDVNGHYEFTGLCEGTYRVRFELPDLPGLVNEAWTTQGGGDVELDSNADADGLTTVITVGDQTNDMSWDAGVIGEAVSSTTVTTIPSTTSTTSAPLTTTTTVGSTSSTTVQSTTSTSVLGAVITTTTTVPPVTAGTLPFTGFEVQTTALIGLVALAGGAALMMAIRGRRDEDDSDSIGAW